MSGRTLYEKLIDAHTISKLSDGSILVYVDFHIMNEYTSPQAFSGLHAKGVGVLRPEAHLAVIDHVNATRQRKHHSPGSQLLIENLEKNCRDAGIAFYGIGDVRQGIEHVVVPEQGLVVPGMLIACGDSHTTTYGAFGALGFGIGTSEVEHVLATQTLRYNRLKTMCIFIDGNVQSSITAKDIIMHVIRIVGAGGANGYAVEFQGECIRALGMAGRMTICNMAVELGARAALIAPDEKTYAAMRDRPQGQNLCFDAEDWQSDLDACFDKMVSISGSDIEPLVTWGTSPDQSCPISGFVPNTDSFLTAKAKESFLRALDYMELSPGQRLSEVAIDMAFIGSCTNSRIEDLRSAAKIVQGRKVAKGVQAIVVPGSAPTRRQAEKEGLDVIFRNAGFDWRAESGCSLCLAMNDDIARDGERVASSTNRNFEGRQGRGARTHLMSPELVAASAITGKLTDLKMLNNLS